MVTNIEILRILREVKGYSQTYVSHFLGIGQNTYSKIESGQIKLNDERIQKLAGLYGIEPEQITAKNLPIVNYNTGTFSKGIVNNENNFSKNELQEKETSSQLLASKDCLIAEKERLISLLSNQLEDLKKEKSTLLDLLKSNR